MRGFPTTFSIIDTETTGMRPGFSRVIDIGIIRVENGKVVRRYETLLNPGIPIPSMITRFNGLSDEAVAGAPTFDEVALEVKELLDGAVFVAHNASFDYGFMKAEFARLGMSFEAETLCSVQLSRTLYPRERSHSLDSIIARHSIECSARHRAMPDAEAVWQYFKLMEKDINAKTLTKAIDYVRRGNAPGIGRDSFREIPDSAGVYFFYGPERELLYVGKSKHLRARTRSHFHVSESGKELKLQRETASIETIRTSGELSALLLEASLVKSESPLYNRALRRKKVLIIARLRNVDGYERVYFERTGDLVPDRAVLGVFRTMRQAKETMQRLAKEHRLCEKMLGVEEGKGACFAYQLGKCDGACVGEMDAGAHRTRIDDAFSKRRMRTWPYAGPIMVREEEKEGEGSVFFIDNWALVGAYRFEDESFEPLLEGHGAFDYDTYKILSRFLRKPANRRAIHTLTQAELIAYLARCSGEEATSIS
jgi:DNA polymerase-3 subunit epsilon